MFELFAVAGEQTSVDIRLSGLAAFADKKWACLVVWPSASNPDPQILTLTEGETAAGIEVVRIFEARNEARIRINGVETILALKHSGIESTARTVPPLAGNLQSANPLPPPRSNTYWRRLETEGKSSPPDPTLNNTTTTE